MSGRPRTECRHLFAQYTAELLCSPLEADHKAASDLLQDWLSANGRIFTELTAKLAHYQQLPWKLLSLAHHLPEERVLGARQCLLLWERQGPGCLHRQSRRFLDPSFQHDVADPTDKSLRQCVEQMAAGIEVTDPCFLSWLSRFAFIRVAERRIEGVHAQITHVIKRARHAETPYISCELRFPDFWSIMLSDPPVP